MNHRFFSSYILSIPYYARGGDNHGTVQSRQWHSHKQQPKLKSHYLPALSTIHLKVLYNT